MCIKLYRTYLERFCHEPKPEYCLTKKSAIRLFNFGASNTLLTQLGSYSYHNVAAQVNWTVDWSLDEIIQWVV